MLELANQEMQFVPIVLRLNGVIGIAITSFDPNWGNQSLNGWMNYILNLRKNALFTSNVINFNKVSTDSDEAKELKADDVVEEGVDTSGAMDMVTNSVPATNSAGFLRLQVELPE